MSEDLVDLLNSVQELALRVKKFEADLQKPAPKPRTRKKPATLGPTTPPASVWVAVVVVVNEVLVRAQPATEKISGMAGLFAKVSSPVIAEQHPAARVAGVADTQEQCEALLAKWKVAHPGIDGEAIVVQVPFGVPVDVTAEGDAFESDALPRRNCIECGAGIVGGHRCIPCTDKYNRSMSLETTDPEAYAEALRMAEEQRNRRR